MPSAAWRKSAYGICSNKAGGSVLSATFKSGSEHEVRQLRSQWHQQVQLGHQLWRPVMLRFASGFAFAPQISLLQAQCAGP